MVSVRGVFEGAGIGMTECVPWGTPVGTDAPGVYAIALTADPDETVGHEVAPLDLGAVEQLLRVRPELAVDGQRPTPEALVARLSAMWVPREVVLYIGLAGTSLTTRVNQYYKTRLGARSPHAGGWPLKTLANLDKLWVHFAPCPDPETAEAGMLAAFAMDVPQTSRSELVDRDNVMPFANLEFPQGHKKRHGITGAREPRKPSVDRSVPPPRSFAPSSRSTPRGEPVGQDLTTQRVTAKDIAGGRIRIPIGQAKSAFPTTRQRVQIDIRGELIDSAWDPRVGTDRERSGVLSVPRVLLEQLLREDERLSIQRVGGVVRFT